MSEIEIPAVTEELETVYIPGGSPDFTIFIQTQGIGNKAILSTINGHFRWVITREDGTRYIARPEEATAAIPHE